MCSFAVLLIDSLGAKQRSSPRVLASFPDIVVRIDLSIVNSFQKSVVLMAGTSAKAAHQMNDVLVVSALSFELVEELLLGQATAEQSKESPLQGSDVLLAETSPVQSDFVYAADFGRIGTGYYSKWRNVPDYG